MTFQVDFYRTGRIFLFSQPTAEDFHIYRTEKCRTKAEAMSYVKGDNGAAECVDAPYNPIKVYRVQKGKKKKLVWSQGWDDCWGGPEIHPK